jgi:hypothetical protein
MSAKVAFSERAIGGNETATMFESSMINEQTSDAVSRTGNLD